MVGWVLGNTGERIGQPSLRAPTARIVHRSAEIEAKLSSRGLRSRKPRSRVIESTGERQPPEEQGAGSCRACVRCSAKLARQSDREDDRHRAGKSHDRPAELGLQHRPACDAGADGRRMSEIVCPVRPQGAPGA
jgi:hypothetical protein